RAGDDERQGCRAQVVSGFSHPLERRRSRYPHLQAAQSRVRQAAAKSLAPPAGGPGNHPEGAPPKLPLLGWEIVAVKAKESSRSCSTWNNAGCSARASFGGCSGLSVLRRQFQFDPLRIPIQVGNSK